MRRSRTVTVVALFTITLAGAATRQPAIAATEVPPLEDYLPRAWYAVEVIVFERGGNETGERFATDPQPPWPRGLRALDSIEPAAFELDPDTHADLDATRALASAPPQTPEPEETPTDPAAPPPAADARLDANTAFLDAVDEFQERLQLVGYKWRPGNELVLNPQATRLARSGLRVLLHEGWMQPVPERGKAEPVLVLAGEPWRGVYPLEGTFEVTLGRYLHFRAVLARRDTSAREPTAPVDGSTAAGPPATGGPNAANSSPFPAPGLPDPAARDAEDVLLLSESRRLKSGEVNYLDHPKLGVIVRVDRVPADDRLLAAYAEFTQAFQ